VKDSINGASEAPRIFNHLKQLKILLWKSDSLNWGIIPKLEGSLKEELLLR